MGRCPAAPRQRGVRSRAARGATVGPTYPRRPNDLAAPYPHPTRPPPVPVPVPPSPPLPRTPSRPRSLTQPPDPHKLPPSPPSLPPSLLSPPSFPPSPALDLGPAASHLDLGDDGLPAHRGSAAAAAARPSESRPPPLFPPSGLSASPVSPSCVGASASARAHSHTQISFLFNACLLGVRLTRPSQKCGSETSESERFSDPANFRPPTPHPQPQEWGRRNDCVAAECAGDESVWDGESW